MAVKRTNANIRIEKGPYGRPSRVYIDDVEVTHHLKEVSFVYTAGEPFTAVNVVYWANVEVVDLPGDET